jgi:hypothetical protein
MKVRSVFTDYHVAKRLPDMSVFGVRFEVLIMVTVKAIVHRTVAHVFGFLPCI